MSNQIVKNLSDGNKVNRSVLRQQYSTVAARLGCVGHVQCPYRVEIQTDRRRGFLRGTRWRKRRLELISEYPFYCSLLASCWTIDSIKDFSLQVRRKTVENYLQ